MILDGHMHITDVCEDQGDFGPRLKAAGIDGGLVMSLPPPHWSGIPSPPSVAERLDNLFFWADSLPNLYPFFWIHPLEDSAREQVHLAAERGVAGFKVICDSFSAGEPQALEVFREIARMDRPILFHSGILWNGRPSAQYNHPEQFEVLLEVAGLKFSLAHISWPWCDELIAVYGKFLNAYTFRPDLSVEMFIDLTPGTPPIYRTEVLTKLLTAGYDVEHNVIFGTDCRITEYNVEWAQEWIKRDRDIYRSLDLSEQTVEQIFSENLRRFVSVSSDEVEQKIPRPGQLRE